MIPPLSGQPGCHSPVKRVVPLIGSLVATHRQDCLITVRRLAPDLRLTNLSGRVNSNVTRIGGDGS